MRPRIKKRCAYQVGTSGDYKAFKATQAEELQKAHTAFMMFSGELQLDVPKPDNSGLVSWTIKGRNVLLTLEEIKWYEKTFK